MKIKEAIILAGGLGTRLRAAVSELPKCLAPVAGRPFLSYLIDYFSQEGIERFVFSLGYKHELVTAFVKEHYPTLPVHFSIEKEPLGTGGGIKLACRAVEEQTVLILNGDTMFKTDVVELAAFHYKSGADCTLSLKPMNNFDRYGAVELNADHSVKSFREKKFYEEGLINGGVYVLNTGSFLKEELPEKFSFEKDYLEVKVGTGKLAGLVQEGYFIDIGIPEDLMRAQQELLKM